MNNELAVQEESNGGISLWRKPEEVLAEAQQAASALTRVISLKAKPVMFNGEQYLELEDWQTVGKFYGLTAKVLETRYVEYGGVSGWEAVAVAINKNGMEVSRAESMCMSDEANWGAVPVYEYKDILDSDGKKQWIEGRNGKKGYYKSEKVQVGTAPKPLFQLRSMAQTRACAKAFRQVLSWVVVLGGFRPNVAEEMFESQLGPEQAPAREPVRQPQRASERPAEVISGDLEAITGVLQTAKTGKDGKSMWMKVNDLTLVADGSLVHAEMVAGNYLSVRARKAEGKAIGTYYKVVEVLECSTVQEGQAEVQEAPQTDQPAAAKSNPELANLFDQGAITTASSLPEAKPDTIGIKRAQRLHALISQYNKQTGYTEDELKSTLNGLSLEHLRDLPVNMYPVIEGYCTGEITDWKGGK